MQPLWELFRTRGSLRVIYALHAELGFRRVAPPLPILPLGNDDQARASAALAAIRDLEAVSQD